MERSVEDTNRTSRHRAEIVLSTGKIIALWSDWKQAHWGEVNDLRLKLIRDAKSRARSAHLDYGVEVVDIRIYREDRTTKRITETSTTHKFISGHQLSREEMDQ